MSFRPLLLNVGVVQLLLDLLDMLDGIPLQQPLGLHRLEVFIEIGDFFPDLVETIF